jgi:hypothetical protein
MRFSSVMIGSSVSSAEAVGDSLLISTGYVRSGITSVPAAT